MTDPADLARELLAQIEDLKTEIKDKADTIRGLEEALEEAHDETEDLENQVDATGSRTLEVVALATRLHERRHQGPLRFCLDETCTDWADLFREFKVDH